MGYINKKLANSNKPITKNIFRAKFPSFAAFILGALPIPLLAATVTISNDPAAGDQTDSRIVADNSVNALGQSFSATATGYISAIKIVGDNNTAVSCNLYIYSGDGVDVGNSIYSQSVGVISDTTNGTTYTLSTLSLSGGTGSTSITSGNSYTFWLTSDENTPSRCIEPLLYNTSTYVGGTTYGDSGGGAASFATFDMVFEVDQNSNTAPTITGAPASAAVTEDVATDVNLSAVTVADSDGDSITLTLGVDAGTIASSDGNGTFSSVTVASSGSASMTLAGTAANINTYLDTTTKIKYTTASNSTSSATLTLTPNDGTENGTADTTTLNVSAVNDAPVLNTGASPALTGINEDAGDDDGSGADGDDDASNNTNNPGTSIATVVVDGSITDVDGGAVEAVAITNVDNTNGVWQYSTDNGTSWNNFSGTTGSSVDISSSARLLDGTLGGGSTQSVRFVPDANHSGTNTLTFKAWDKSSGSAGGTADTTGGSTAFSSSGDTASVVVSAVNDVPTIGSLAGDSINFIQGNIAKLVDQSSNASVNDIDSTDFDSGNLTVSIVTNKDAAEDQLSFDTSGVVSLAGTTAGSNVSVSGTIVGTLGNNIAVGNDLVVNFGSNANASRTESLIRAVTYQNTDGASPTINTRTLRFTVTDGDGGTSVNTDTSVVVNAADGDGNLVASATVTEPVAINTTVDTDGEFVNIFDFTLSDGGTADGIAMAVSAISVQVTGTASDAQRAKVTWRLNGPDATHVVGSYDAPNNEIDFTALNISVADGASETYTINAFYNDNAGLTEGLTYILSVDGGTNVTTSGTSMGATSVISNSTGSTVEVNTTELVFTTQPATSTSGSALGTQPVVSAQDAFGNTDTGFTETITLTESSAGTLSGDVDIAAVSGVATFTDVVYTATADQQAFILTANDEDGTSTDLSMVNANAVTSDVVATKLVFDTQPAPLSLESAQATNFTTVPVVSAQDANNVVDTGYATGITLAEVSGAGSATMSATGDTDGSGATVTITPSSGVSTFTAMQITYTASGGSDENFNLQASSGGLSTANSSQFTSGTFDSDANVTVAAGVTEPIGIDTTLDSSGEALAIFDFTITDGGTSDAKVTSVTAIDLHASGTADASKLTYVLNGPDATNVTGSFSANTVTFSGLSISVADNANEIYTVSAYFNDNSGITEGQTVILSTNGDTDFTLAGNSTRMASTSAVNNGTGTTIDVVATELRFTTQPASSTSGSVLGTQPIVSGTDAFGNVDTDFTETITVTEASAGILSNNTQAAVSGAATFTNLTYTATADQQSFTLTANDQDGVGSDLSTVDANSVTSDVVATTLVYDTEPVPLLVNSGLAQSFTTVPIIQAVDNDGLLDSGYTTDFVLSETGGPGAANITATGDSDGNNATVTLTPTAGAVTVNGLQITYTAVGAGESFKLHVTSGGLAAGDTNLISVNMLPTVVGLPTPVAINEDVLTNLTLSALDFEDADNDSITATFAVNRGILVASDGDGTFSGVTVAGSNGASGSTSITFNGTAANLDTYFDLAGKLKFQTDADDTTAATLTLTPNDGTADGSAANATINITGINDAPSISGTPSTSVTAGQAYSFTPNANDPEGDAPLVFSITNKPTWAAFDTNTGALTGTPADGDVGITSGIVIRVEDPSSAGNDLTAFNLTVNSAAPPVNTAPVINQGASTTVVMSEDSAPTAFSLTLNATDAEGDALSWSVLGAATNGNASVNGSGNQISVNYVPQANFSGSDSFSIRVRDSSSSDTITVNVTIQPVNDAPTISGTPATSVRVTQSYQFTPTAADVENETLQFSISNKPTWAFFDTQTGELSGTPAVTDTGTTSNIVISVSDGTDTADLSAFGITVENTNSAPIATSQQIAVNEDSSLNITLQATDADDDELSFELVSQVQSGVLSGSGASWTYTPTENFNGADSFTFKAKDILSESETATVSITVNPVNDEPVANDDSFTMELVESGSYSLTVLVNDEDIDNDELIIEGASANIGSVSINESLLNYQSTDNFVGNVELRYSIRDSGDARDSATVLLTIQGTVAGEPPVVTAPEDIVVNATGLFTKVDLGVATAVDSEGNPLSVEIVEGNNLFAPGQHTVYWKAEDSLGSSSTVEQKVTVHPLISLSKDQMVSEGSSVAVEVLLNGSAPEYPLVVAYSVSGTATSDDHTAQNGEVSIASGSSTKISFNTLQDGISDSNETIVIQLVGGNQGSKNTTQITISETNIAPDVDLSVVQSGENRLTVSQDGGNVSVTASVSDANERDSVSLDWTSSDELQNLSTDNNFFEFSPSGISPGVYRVSALATDSGTPALSDRAEVFIDIQEVLQTLGGEDTDGDLIPDDQEGYADDDRDGIPDYLDAISDCNVVPEQVETQDGFLVEGEPGVCLRRGSTSTTSETGGLELTEDESDAQLGEDDQADNVGGIFDFIAYGLPEAGQTYQLVIPQNLPVPAGSVYRKFSQSKGWFTFESNELNKVFSTLGEPGVCPPPGDVAWLEGLTEGHWCVQLQIEDGGPNDDDGERNGAIVDPGGVAVLISSNVLPVANADSVEMVWNSSIVIDVLQNDSDPDNDILTVTSAIADFGEVEVNADNTLTYTSQQDFSGIDSIVYVITDNNGGTGSAEVQITVISNRAPVAVDDQVNVDTPDVVILDVLANDTDQDGDTLTIQSANAGLGQVSITADNTLSYTAPAAFVGSDVITYQIVDPHGAVSTAQVAISVNTNLAPVLTPDTAETTENTAVTINVLINDTDDGDYLSVVSATPDSGAVVINDDDTLTYTPKMGFSGNVSITYEVTDRFVVVASQVQVTVVAGATPPPPPPTPNPPTPPVNRSSGGSMGFWVLALVVLIGWRRNTQAKQAQR